MNVGEMQTEAQVIHLMKLKFPANFPENDIRGTCLGGSFSAARTFLLLSHRLAALSAFHFKAGLCRGLRKILGCDLI